MPEKHYFRLLVLVALADWLVSRSLARMAIFMPKTPLIITIYRDLSFAGQYASVLCALLALFGIGWIAWRLRRRFGGVSSVAFACLGLLGLALLLPAPNGWLQIISLLLVLGIAAWLGVSASMSAPGMDRKIAILVPAAAVWMGGLYHTIQSLYSALRLPGPPAYTPAIFNLGELLVVLTPFCLWWVYGRQDGGRGVARAYLWGFLPAALFMISRLANPAMAGILAIWSTGLTLYLPAPLYAVALWLGIATLLISRKQGSPAAWVLLLLACAGYAPQLSSQIFLSLIALSLLANLWVEPGAAVLAPSLPGLDFGTRYESRGGHSISSEHLRV